MKFFKRDKVSHVTVGKDEGDDFKDDRDFDKKRRERLIWRHMYSDPLLDFP